MKCKVSKANTEGFVIRAKGNSEIITYSADDEQSKVLKIKELESMGLSVTVKNSDGTIVYSTNNDKCKYCDDCKYLEFLPDPDPSDWFRDDDKKAVCRLAKKEIVGGLEWNELKDIHVPDFCPKKD